MIISFALGNFWRFSQNQNRANALKWIQKLSVDGVELTLGKKEQFKTFRLNAKQKDYLSGLEYVSVHAPFRSAKKYSSPEEHEKDLNRVQEIYEDSHAQIVVFHPSYLPSKKLLKKFRFKIALENMEKEDRVSLQRLANLMRDYKTSFCLDTSHAYEYGPFRTRLLLKHFEGHLQQIHFSANYRRHNHHPLTKASPAFLKSIEPLKETNVPIVIEEDFRRLNLPLAKKEIEWTKMFFEPR